MWSAGVIFLTQIVVCQFATENPSSPSTEKDQTVTSFYALSTDIAPAPVMLRLGNSTIDSTKSFRVPQPSQKPTELTQPDVIPKVDMVPHVVSVKNTYFDHDRKYGPNFEDTPEGNITKTTVQLGEDAYLNCRISLLLDKTVSWVRRRGRDEMPELLTVGATTYAADNRVTVAKRYPGNWRLLIREVKPDDEGVYECQISTHPPRVSRTYLHVNTPQVWVVDEAGAPLLEKYYEAESTLALVCRARHVETPALLTWLHEGRALNADTTRGGISVKTEQVTGGADSLLRLARVNTSDSGNYTCVVRGARSHTVSVHVLNESLAELHAGAKTHQQPSLPTVTTLLTVLVIITERSLLKTVIVIFFAALACTLSAQGLTTDRFVVLLPT
ncbi:hemicentin-1-like [Aphomia sociella]